MLRGMVIALMLFGLASSADAGTLLLKDYKAPKDEHQKNTFQSYLNGVGDGLLALTAEQIRQGKQPLFCMPMKLEMTVDQIENIMLRKAKEVGDADDYPVSIILVQGLQDTFPCDAKH